MGMILAMSVTTMAAPPKSLSMLTLALKFHKMQYSAMQSNSVQKWFRMYDREKKHWTVPQGNAQWTWLDPLAKCSSAYKGIWKDQTNAMHTVQVSFIQCILVQLSSMQCIWRKIKELKQPRYCSRLGAIPSAIIVLCNRKALRCLGGKNGNYTAWARDETGLAKVEWRSSPTLSSSSSWSPHHCHKLLHYDWPPLVR